MKDSAAFGRAAEREFAQQTTDITTNITTDAKDQKTLISKSMEKIFMIIGVRSPLDIQNEIKDPKQFEVICKTIIITLKKIKISVEKLKDDEKIISKFFEEIKDKDKFSTSLTNIRGDYEDIITRIEDYISYWEECLKKGKIKDGYFFTKTAKFANTSVREYIGKILNKDVALNNQMLDTLKLVYKHA